MDNWLIGYVKKALCISTKIILLPRVFGQLGLGQQKPREKPNKPKKTIRNGLTQDSSHRIVFFVFVFLGFPRVFGQLGLGQQKPREKPNKPKNTILNGLTQDSSHRIFFLFFLVFLEFLDSWAWDSKKPEKKQIKPKTTILNGLTQDSSHRDVFFCFFWCSSSFWTVGLGTAKTSRKTK